jgi:hypothetical protein
VRAVTTVLNDMNTANCGTRQIRKGTKFCGSGKNRQPVAQMKFSIILRWVALLSSDIHDIKADCSE